MGSVWVSQISSSEDEIRIDFLNGIMDDLEISFTQWVFSDFSALVEGEVKREGIFDLDSCPVGRDSGLRSSDECLDVSDIEVIVLALLLRDEILIDLVALFDDVLLVREIGEHELLDEIVVFLRIVVLDGYVTGCLVSNEYVMSLLDEFFHGGSHANDIIIRMWGEDQDVFLLNCLLVEVVVIKSLFRLSSARPGSNLILNFLENLEIKESDLIFAVLLDQFHEPVRLVVILNKPENGLFELFAEPDDSLLCPVLVILHIGVIVDGMDCPGSLVSCQESGGWFIEDHVALRVML